MLFPLFKSFNSRSGIFSMEAITENQLHNFLIDSRHSYKKILFTQLHNIMRDYNHHRSFDKISAQDGRLYRQKIVIFPAFSPYINNLPS